MSIQAWPGVGLEPEACPLSPPRTCSLKSWWVIRRFRCGLRRHGLWPLEPVGIVVLLFGGGGWLQSQTLESRAWIRELQVTCGPWRLQSVPVSAG